MLLPPIYLNAVVSIEKETGDDNFQSIATGFLVGFLTGGKSAEDEALYRVYLVTNRHVLEGKSQIILRFNIIGQVAKRYPVELIDKNGKKQWLAHPNEKVDISVILIDTKYLKEEGIEFIFFTEKNMAFKKEMKELGISQGDEIFVLGFPMGITGVERNYVIVRSGIIARLDDEILNNEFSYLIDSKVFPGNSGGPVVLKPSNVSLEGTKPVDKAYLIGVVSSYMTYNETAISEQTGKPRVVFTENSGLAMVVPMDFVRDIARADIQTFKFIQTKV